MTTKYFATAKTYGLGGYGTCFATDLGRYDTYEDAIKAIKANMTKDKYDSEYHIETITIDEKTFTYESKIEKVER